MEKLRWDSTRLTTRFAGKTIREIRREEDDATKRDDRLVLVFEGGTSLEVQPNFVVRNDDEEIDPDLIQCQLDVDPNPPIW